MLYPTRLITFICALFTCTALSAAEPQQRDTHDTERKLVRSLQAINNNRLDIALNEVDKLLQLNPNFKLAQLVRGDLLMTRAGAFNSFGSAANATSSDIDDLRDEARVRLQRVLTQADAGLKPRFLWKMDAQQKYALVVDASRSTLFIYENVNGEPRYVTDFYITLGKLGTEKALRGDQRTPIGVYFILAEMPKNQLSDFYGDGAFPITYPNELDRKSGRTGSGIWLHGTPSDTYSRPPRASNGCLVLANDDLNKLSPYIQADVTPIIISNQMDWSTANDTIERDNLLEQIEQWRKDWASLDTDAYLQHYASNFSSEDMDLQQWTQRKKLVNSAKSWINISLSNFSMFSYPEQTNLVVVNFEQDYSSSNLTNRMKKRQYWIKHNNRWQIIYEGSA